MRESKGPVPVQTRSTSEPAPPSHRACDGRAFFESFYRSNIRGAPEDRMTIGSITELEARYHYNCMENAIIASLVRREPPPQGALVEAWRLMRKRQGIRLLDVGSGTGHWVDFFREVLLVSEVAAVEITGKMAAFLVAKYAGQEVTVLQEDIASTGFGPELIGGPVDHVSAIGVMFHIVEDDRWRDALVNLARCLKPGGLLFAGGDFGPRTRDVQFHRSDEFASWREFNLAKGEPGVLRVNKRVRSLSDWTEAARTAGLRVVELVRTPREASITTPENDLLVLERPGRES